MIIETCTCSTYPNLALFSKIHEHVDIQSAVHLTSLVRYSFECHSFLRHEHERRDCRTSWKGGMGRYSSAGGKKKLLVLTIRHSSVLFLVTIKKKSTRRRKSTLVLGEEVMGRPKSAAPKKKMKERFLCLLLICR